MHQIAYRHYAFEGRCFVLLAGGLLRVRDLPDDDELRTAMLGGLATSAAATRRSCRAARRSWCRTGAG